MCPYDLSGFNWRIIKCTKIQKSINFNKYDINYCKNWGKKCENSLFTYSQHLTRKYKLYNKIIINLIKL